MQNPSAIALWLSLTLTLAGCGGGGGGETTDNSIPADPVNGPIFDGGNPTQERPSDPQFPPQNPPPADNPGNGDPVDEPSGPLFPAPTPPSDDRVDPNEPTEPTEPVAPTEPVVPTEPVAPTEPVDPGEPSEPTDPADPPPNDEPDPGVPTDPELAGIFDGIVYTRQPRATAAVPGLAAEDASNWQHVSDVGRINGGIAEADVVINDLEGNEEVIHNCTSSPEICVAQEARVSPDGSKIAYSVGYGNSLTEVMFGGARLGIFDIPALTHAQIFIYDMQTAVSTPVPNHPAGAIDRQPEWLDNNTIVFASNRGNTYPHKSQYSQHRGRYEDGRQRWFATSYAVSQPYGYGNAGKSMQIWSMDIDGTNPRNLTPHETMALSPMVMTNGDVLYSCWNGHANEAFDAPYRTTNGPGTEVNKWWLCQMDANGAGGHVALNGHKTPTLKTRGWLDPGVTGGEGSSTLRAVRSAAEIRPGYIAVTNYYRSNHTGSMGIVYGFDYKGPGIEGVARLDNFQYGVYSGARKGSGRYVPSDLLALTPYGNDQDTAVRRDSLGRALGKAGYASALPGTNDYMVTHARGECYEAIHMARANTTWTGGEPLCQKGIYRVRTDQVTDPFDTSQMTLLAGGDQWQAFDADAITNYQSLWGQPIPDRPTALSGNSCFLQVVDARAAELQAPNAYNWNTTLYEQCSTQGCAVNSEDPSFHGDQLRYLTVYEVEPWDVSYSNGNQATFGNTTNNHGFKSLGVWGYQEIESDGSVRMEVPCETPIQIVGQDENNMTIAHDDKLHSLRRGETRTCHGCHDGHSEERAAELPLSAEVRFDSTLAAATNRARPDNGFRREWSDIESIIVTRCSSCHADMTNDDGLLDSRIAWDYEQLDWPWVTRQPIGNETFRMPRPYTSKWVGKLARNSLLYWKCMGSRQDGRTDRQYPGDIDFGDAHDSGATLEECKAIGQWIDQGIQRDPN